MNAANILPRGSDMLPADKVGVQRKTKVNIEAWRGNKVESPPFLKRGLTSTRACTMPSLSMVGLAKIDEAPSLKHE